MEQYWTWANLTPQQQRILSEAERHLGEAYLLAYQPLDPSAVQAAPSAGVSLPAAPLSERQLDRLLDLEAQVGAIVVAYRKETV
ncbi:MAG: hypothetical protein RLZZ387_5205 [Chloroflexota bacterium]|jgi:hypothetical protein